MSLLRLEEELELLSSLLDGTSLSKKDSVNGSINYDADGPDLENNSVASKMDLRGETGTGTLVLSD